MPSLISLVTLASVCFAVYHQKEVASRPRSGGPPVHPPVHPPVYPSSKVEASSSFVSPFSPPPVHPPVKPPVHPKGPGSQSSPPTSYSGENNVGLPSITPHVPMLFSVGGLENGFQQSHNAGTVYNLKGFVT